MTVSENNPASIPNMKPPAWWAETPWWDDPIYATHFGNDRDKFQAALEVMKRYFDRSWWENVFTNSKRNWMAKCLIPKGEIPLKFIWNIGTDIQLLENSEGFMPSKMSELKRDETGSIQLECEIGAIFRRAGLKVSFPKSNNRQRTPDLIINDQNHKFAMECKKFDIEERELWARDLMLETMKFLSLNAPNNITVHIELYDRLSDIRTTDKDCPGLNEAILKEIVNRLRTSVYKVITTANPLPDKFVIPGLGECHVMENNGDTPPSIAGFDISPFPQLRRITVKGLYEGCGQIPKELPGIVVIQCVHLPDADLTQLVFDVATETDHVRFDRIVALLIIPLQYINQSRQSLLFLNRHSPYAGRPMQALKVLGDAIKPIVYGGEIEHTSNE